MSTPASFVVDVLVRQPHFTLDASIRAAAHVLAIFGPSGAGKTTLLEAVAGLRMPERGEVRVNSACLFDSSRGIDVPVRQRRIGYVPQDIALFPHMSARRNMLYGARDTSRVAAVVEMLELADVVNRRNVRLLSGGERQRLSIARALLSNPEVLLLDEPLSGVDVERRRRILERLRADVPLPTLYVTHDPGEVRLVADCVAVLDAGRVIRTGHPDDVLKV